MRKISKIELKLSSPEFIESSSYGEVKSAETINYRSFEPAFGGLFCQSIFGTINSWRCGCGKYNKIRYKNIICENCKVEVSDSIVRRYRKGYISLATPLVNTLFAKAHPNPFCMLLGISSKEFENIVYYYKYIVTEVGESEFNLFQIIDEKEYQSALHFEGFEAKMGGEGLLDALKKIDLKSMYDNLKSELVSIKNDVKKKKLVAKIKLIKNFINSGTKPEWMILTKLPVLPADLRPMVLLDGGRFATSDINDLYRIVIFRNNRLNKILLMDPPSVISRQEKRMLQSGLDNLLHNKSNTYPATSKKRILSGIIERMSGKKGTLRGNLLGKRTDFSGRSVIVCGPELSLDQCSLPKQMALELFKPFIIRDLIKNQLAFNISAAESMIHMDNDEIWPIVQSIVENYPVLLNRAPTLHKHGIQAFFPKLTDGKAIRIPPLCCAAMNADFDGDQVAVHVQFSPEAISESINLMLPTKNVIYQSNGDPVIQPSGEMLTGCYYMTLLNEKGIGANDYFISVNEAKIAHLYQCLDMNSPVYILIEGIIRYTSLGRALLNEIFPTEFRNYEKAFVKKDFKIILKNIFKSYGKEYMCKVADEIKNFGFKYSTLAGISMCVDDLQVPKEKNDLILKGENETNIINEKYINGEIISKERHNAVVGVWSKIISELSDHLLNSIDKFNPVYLMANCGAKGGILQMRQLCCMRGLLFNVKGEIVDVPVIRSFRDGLKILDIYVACGAARKVSSDKSLRTADAGYLTRKLVDTTHKIFVREEDCGSTSFVEISDLLNESGKVVSSVWNRAFGRTIAKDIIVNDSLLAKSGEFITDTIIGVLKLHGISKILIRSLFDCQTKNGVCQKCYGFDLSAYNPVVIGEPVGVIAAQAIGEPGTQLTMKTFHGGGVIENTMFSDDILSPIDGEVDVSGIEIMKKNDLNIVTKSGFLIIGNKSVGVPMGHNILVKHGDYVKKDDIVCCSINKIFKIISNKDGFVDLSMVEYNEHFDKKYGVNEFIVRKSKSDNKILIRNSKGDIVDEYFVPIKSFIIVRNKDKVKKGDIIAKIFKTDATSGKGITGGLPKVQQLFEARSSALKAVLSDRHGIVEISQNKKRGLRVVFVKDIEDSSKYSEFVIPRVNSVIVNDGDIVNIGGRLTNGTINVDDILKIKGIKAAQKYLLESVQLIYREQNANINDKHIELIVSRMFRRVKIVKSNVIEYLEGDIVDIEEILEINKRLIEKDEEPIIYDRIISGITKVALDSNFLSSVSFQETSKVIVSSVISGAVDNFIGLKENVMFGNPIPVGTGFNMYRKLMKKVSSEVLNEN